MNNQENFCLLRTNTYYHCDSDNNEVFGKFVINASHDVIKFNKNITLFITIDTSSSMADICTDGLTKIVHVKNTLQNMVSLFKEMNNVNVKLSIHTFDTDVYDVLGGVVDVNNDTHTIISKISRIMPSGLTNMESALSLTKIKIDEYHKYNPTHEIVHILLTDGIISKGFNNINVLKYMVSVNCKNIFIGYGHDYDSVLLSKLSEVGLNDEYRVIDAPELIGHAFGEIIYQIIYKFNQTIILTISNGKLYNWKTNTWDDTLNIDGLVSEKPLQFYFKSKYRENADIQLYVKNSENIQMHNKSFCFNLQNDLLNYSLLTLLNEIKNNAELGHSNTNISDFNVYKERTNTLKDKCIKLYNEMKKSLCPTSEHIQMMLDDIYVVYKTIGTKKSHMYSHACIFSDVNNLTFKCNNFETNKFIQFNNQNTISFEDKAHNNSIMPEFKSASHDSIDFQQSTNNVLDNHELIGFNLSMPNPVESEIVKYIIGKITKYYDWSGYEN